MSAPRVIVRALGTREYRATWQAMQDFTAERTPATPDEVWLLQHPPVYTLGRNAKHQPATAAIPVIACDRGGDITYHGPGQIVLYALIDLTRRGSGVKALVHALEQAAIDFLADSDIVADRRGGAPGVYVEAQKIAALGLRVRHGCSYHGLAFNFDMDLAPFADIAPCGYPGLQVTHYRALRVAAEGKNVSTSRGKSWAGAVDPTTAGEHICAHFLRNMGYNRAQIVIENTDVIP